MKIDLEAQRMRLSGLKVSKVEVKDADLRNALAQSSFWEEVSFSKVRFAGSDFSGATFKDCVFTDCQMGNAIWTVRMHGCQLTGCDFDHAAFTAAYLTNSAFINCRAQFSNWHRATITESKMDLDFRGAHLNMASTTNVDWSGSDFWSAMMPMNCAMYSGNTFDERQVRSFAALFLLAKLPEKLVFKVNALTDARARKLIGELTRPRVEVDIQETA